MTNQIENKILEDYRTNRYFLAKDLLGYKDLTVNFHYKYICTKLQEPRKKNIRLWLLPRGFFKTTILTITDSIALQLQNPSIRILIVSGVLANSVSMVTAIGNVYLTNRRFLLFFPDWCPVKPQAPETTWKGNEIHIPNRGGRPVMEGTFEAFGPDSTLTSRHYDYIKMDDLVTRENSTTKDQMDKIKTFYKAVFPLRDNPHTPVDIIGTIWDDYDLYGDLQKDEDIEVIKVPAILDRIATFPERYPLHELETLRKDKKMSNYLFSCLYLLDPIPQEDAIFKEKWFKYFRLSSDKRTIYRKEKDGSETAVPVGLTFMTMDGAVTEGKNDYSAIMITTTDHEKNIYVLKTWSGQVDPITLMDKMFELYFEWNCIKLGAQTSIIEKMLSFFLKRRMIKEKKFMNMIPLRKNTAENKEYSIKSMAGWYESGCIFHIEGERSGNLEEQLLRFPKARHDDLADVLQMQQEIVVSSSKKAVMKDFDRNSLHSWKRRLKKVFDTGEYFHLGEDQNNTYKIDARTY